MFAILWSLALELYYSGDDKWHEDLSKAILFDTMDHAKAAADRIWQKNSEMKYFCSIIVVVPKDKK